MANQNWVSLLNPDVPYSSGPGASLTLAASTQIASPITSVAGADVAVINGPGQYLGWKPGLLIRVTARGFYTTNTTTGTLTVLLRANKNNTNGTQTTLATCNGITTGATAMTGIQWKLEALIRCMAVGTASACNTQGEFGLQGLLASGTALAANPQALTTGISIGAAFPMPAISGETAVNIDSTQNQGINMAVTCTAASGTFQCTQWLVEVLN